MNAIPLSDRKFRDPERTADGFERARAGFAGLKTLWFNTGTLCNLACATCYIESSPANDALVYLSAQEVDVFLEEIRRERLPTREIGFTGGEPFLNKDIIAMLKNALARGHSVLVLTNAMRPMRRHEAALLKLRAEYGDKLTLRVSLDSHIPSLHEVERGEGSWEPALSGLRWLSNHEFSIAVAGRRRIGETEMDTRTGYAALFAEQHIPVDASSHHRLVLFPAMDAAADVPEITTACWAILKKDPAELMCASSRMVVKRKGEAMPRVVACTLTPYGADFDLGQTLIGAERDVFLNHPHCARFCVLGGASCSA